MPVTRVRSAAAQVVQQRLTDHRRQGERGGMPCLTFGDRQTVTFPVDVIQGQRGHLPGPQPVGDQQQQDGVITAANRGAPVNSGQDPIHLSPRDRAGDIRHPVDLRPAHRVTEVTGQHALPVGIPQEHP